MTLAEFLAARFDETEAAVKKNLADFGEEPESWCDRADGLHLGTDRVLADIESKRKILAMLDTSGEDYYLGGLSLGIMDALTEPYRDHPDYGEV